MARTVLLGSAGTLLSTSQVWEQRIRVEIEADTDPPGGFPDSVVRTVSENANTLKITEHNFEGR